METTKNSSPKNYCKEFFTYFLMIFCISTGIAQNTTNESGWHLTDYSFKDGSLQKTSVLAGTSATMNDAISYKGAKGNMDITYNRTDVATGKLLAGVTYNVTWTDPPSIIKPNEKIAFDFQLKTLSTFSVWKAPQQSMHFNQGMNGVYFVTPDGTKYITKDIKSTLTTEKVIDKGTKGTKRFIQMNFGNGFRATYNYEWRDAGTLEKPIVIDKNTNPGWHLTNYTFKDGSLQKTSVLAGTSATMNDAISYKGAKGNMDITYNRTDVATGKLLAGVTYNVTWTDPPSILKPNEKIAFDFQLKTISTFSVWKAPQQSMHFNQGLSGVYFVTPDGTKYITKDIKSTLTTEKVIDKGTKGTKRFIQMNFGNGFRATYDYEWRE